MDLIDVTTKIEEKIASLEQFREELERTAKEKAITLSNYDKELAKVIISLKNGKSYILESVSIEKPLTTIIEKIAKGICWEEALKKDLAETSYKNTIEVIDIVKAQLNGYQTIQRHLSHL